MWQWNKPSETDKDGVWHFPTGMCTNTFTVNVGYGPTDTYPCADKATRVVTFNVWAPELDSPDGWAEAIMYLCDRCNTVMRDEDGDFMRTVSNEPYVGEYDGREVSDNPDN